MIAIPVTLAAAYLIMVSFCVCERMTKFTNHNIRVLVLGIGGVGFWALCKTPELIKASTVWDMAFSVFVIASAIVVGMSPRIDTTCHDNEHVVSNRKVG